MKFGKLSKVLAGLLLTVGVAQADLTAELHGVKGNADAQSKAFLKKIDAVGFQWAGNDNIQIPYFKKFHDKNLDLLSFFTVTNLDVMRELLLKNPDFGAYAPYNMLFYKLLDSKEKTTWFGHLDADLMLNIIGEKDEANRKTFKDMVASLDEVAMKELKPTESKKLEYTDKLPEQPLTKMVMKLPDSLKDTDAITEWTENWVETHDGAFVKNEFIIAGFLDFKLEYDDAEKEFSKYDAYWVSSLCHFKFSNSIFNHGEPQAGLFAPCSIYFYVPKGSKELHVGYANVKNWLATTGIKDEAMRKSIEEIDKKVVETFKSLGFELENASDAKKEAPVKKEAPAKKAA